ncbi:MAG: hypothetical protein KBC84_05325 [Proteobacteria bacterium]|nr:hypothetical protein [Pseudomonadota bacterium]
MTNKHGNSTLEMILFLPLFLLFSLYAIDQGFSLKERASTIDAINQSLNSVLELEKDSNLFHFDDEQNLEISSDAAREFLTKVANKINIKIIESRGINITKKISTTVALVKVQFNEETGEISDYEILQPVISTSAQEIIRTEAGSSFEDYISNTIDKTSLIQVDFTNKFKRQIYYIASDVRVIPTGPSSDYTKNSENVPTHIYQRNFIAINTERI